MGKSNITHDLLRPMGIGDILDGAIKLYRNNFLLLIGIGAWVYIPLCLLGFVISQVIFNLLIQLISIFLAAVVTVAISERILDREISIAGSYSRVGKKLPSLIGAMLLVALVGVIILIGVGAFMSFFTAALRSSLRSPTSLLIFTLVIGLSPLIFVLAVIIWLLFTPQAILLEGNTAGKSIRRSMNLVKGSFWKTLLILVLVSIAMSLVSSLLWLVGGAGVAILGGGADTGQSFVQNIGVAMNKFRQYPIAIGIINLLLQPFRMVVITLLYYDIRVRKEGYDLEVMAKELAMEVPEGYGRAQLEQESMESEPEEIQGRRIDQYQKEMLRQKILEQQGSSLSDGQQGSKTVQSSEARLSLILGFCSVGCELIAPFFLFLGLWLPAVAIIFGVKGLNTINRKGGVLEFTGKGLAIWGILLGIFSYMLLALSLAG